MNNKKELRPIYNEDIKGHKEYMLEQLEKYNSGDLNFTHKRINNKIIEEYTKYFIYKDNTFMAVKPSEDGYPSGYYEHVKQYNYKIDHINKIILFTDTEVGEVQEVEPMGEGQKIDNNINIEEYANNLIESLPIEKNKSAVKYLDYAKENNIKTNDKNSIERKVLQIHLMRYGVSNAWYKAAEKKGVNTKEELAKVYFNELVKMLKEEFYNIDNNSNSINKKEFKYMNNIYIDLKQFTDNKIHDIKEYTVYKALEGVPQRGECKKFYYNNDEFIRVSYNRLSQFKKFTLEQYNLLIRLQAAAEKQRKSGFSSRHKELYKKLLNKIDAVYNNNYNIKDVSVDTIASAGGLVPSVNMNFKDEFINRNNIINNKQINEIIEEFKNINLNNKEETEEEQQKKNLKLIFDTLKSKINNYIEIVDDIEYFDKFINGIVLYFPNGECYQIFIDIDNKVNNNNNFIVLDENINILYNSNDINYIIDNVIKSAQEKNYYINNSKEYIQI